MQNDSKRRPAATEHAPYYARYIDRVPETDVVAALESQAAETAAVLRSVGEEASKQRYEEGKWSVRELLGHVTDAERVFAFRALAFARGDTSELPGFDENSYVERSGFDAVSLAELAGALATTRAATLNLFRTLPAEAWDRIGVANGDPISVRALAYAIDGHERHHLGVLRERYLGAK